MGVYLERKSDGSVALYVDADLQLDSRDERIYHESLALPALALAKARSLSPVRALIVGGGDGCVARELEKDPDLFSIDLVDYDPKMIRLAREEGLGAINDWSLEDRRLRVVVADAWDFVEEARQNGNRYDLIVVDLTVPTDPSGARFWSVEWQERLKAILEPKGLIAQNVISPHARPLAYWAVYNALRRASLNPRPYRIALPSFAAAGYGPDWGFIVASPEPIAASELCDALSLESPRQALKDAIHLRRLFEFPPALAALRADARPLTIKTAERFTELLALNPNAYFGAGYPGTEEAPMWSSLASAEDAALPEPLLPKDEESPLPESIEGVLRASEGQVDETALLGQVLDLLPALNPTQTRSMVASFVEEPERFLDSIDLRALVERLLARAAELPKKLVVELMLLKENIGELLGNRERLLGLGLRLVTIITIVVIVGNLLFPDTVYGKGTTSSGGTLSTSGTDALSLSRPSYGSNSFSTVQPDYAAGGGFRSSTIGRGTTVDEVGSSFPSRSYRYFPIYYGGHSYSGYRYGTTPTGRPALTDSYFRLTPEADILDGGQVVINIAENGYLLLSDQVTTLIDAQTGQPILFLKRDPIQIWRVAREIDRQNEGLKMSIRAKETWIDWMGWLGFAPWNDDDQRELVNLRDASAKLTMAKASLGKVPQAAPSATLPPATKAIELFSGVWISGDGLSLTIQRPTGEVAFLDGKGWYFDGTKKSAVSAPYPTGFKTFMVSYLETAQRERDSARTRLNSDLALLQADLSTLNSDLSEYNTIALTESQSSSVDYGSTQITLAEALRRTNDDIAATRSRIDTTQNRINAQPTEAALMTTLLGVLK